MTLNSGFIVVHRGHHDGRARLSGPGRPGRPGPPPGLVAGGGTVRPVAPAAGALGGAVGRPAAAAPAAGPAIRPIRRGSSHRTGLAARAGGDRPRRPSAARSSAPRTPPPRRPLGRPRLPGADGRRSPGPVPVPTVGRRGCRPPPPTRPARKPGMSIRAVVLADTHIRDGRPADPARGRLPAARREPTWSCTPATSSTRACWRRWIDRADLRRARQQRRGAGRLLPATRVLDLAGVRWR